MEDAVALAKAFAATKDRDIPAALALFQQQRLPPMRKIWDAANASLRWYEGMDRLVESLEPIELAYSYMTRTGRIDHAEVCRRDPGLAAAYEALHPQVAKSPDVGAADATR
jgi:2-polyprenyl-6-methoxyphenol hydroxylase-like FAD-dependent oxidoreductase